MRLERVKQVAAVFYTSRYDAGKTQEYMAFELGVSKKTISNWENGTSCPSLLQFSEWFRVLNLNPMPYISNMLHPNKFNSLKSKEEIDDAFECMCQQLPTSDKEALIFIFTGKHGSSPHSLIQLLLAHIHTPLSTRVTQADTIQNMYEMHRDLDTLICKDDIMPDMEDLEKARKYARLSVVNKEYGYNITE